jgi:hypothetical protein
LLQARKRSNSKQVKNSLLFSFSFGVFGADMTSEKRPAKIYKLYPSNYSDFTYVEALPESVTKVNGTIVRNIEKNYKVIIILWHSKRKPSVKSFFSINRPRTVLGFGMEFDATRVEDECWAMSTKIVDAEKQQTS